MNSHKVTDINTHKGARDTNTHKEEHRYKHAQRSPIVPHQDTGWRRLIGCLKLQVNFRKRATNYRALLRKMMMLHSPLCVFASRAPLCICIQVCFTMYLHLGLLYCVFASRSPLLCICIYLGLLYYVFASRSPLLCICIQVSFTMYLHLGLLYCVFASRAPLLCICIQLGLLYCVFASWSSLLCILGLLYRGARYSMFPRR